MISSWKVDGINDSWWLTTFRKAGSNSHTIQHLRRLEVLCDFIADLICGLCFRVSLSLSATRMYRIPWRLVVGSGRSRIAMLPYPE